ncbi:hypothetical protein [Nitrosomonas aestuarii]|nr:hypothetical protein [Nitrosomonas aestuarii]
MIIKTHYLQVWAHYACAVIALLTIGLYFGQLLFFASVTFSV